MFNTAPRKQPDVRLQRLLQQASTQVKSAKVVIVGGSIAGLCAGIALHHIGLHDIVILERSSRNRMLENGAGIVVQPDLYRFLREFANANDEVFDIERASKRVLVDSCGVNQVSYEDQMFTSWHNLFNYLFSVAVRKGIRYLDKVDVKSVDVSASEEGRSSNIVCSSGDCYEADLVLGCDGLRSKVRSQVLAEQHGEQGSKSDPFEPAGYVAWRGLVECACFSDTPEVTEFFDDSFTVYRGDGFHALVYKIPSRNGRVYNWIWYENVSNDEILEIFRDKTGVRRSYSVPKGMLDDQICMEQKRKSQALFPSHFALLIEKTDEVFLQEIGDTEPIFLPCRRVCLLGDAACLLRPHSAAGSSKAAVDAWFLAQCLSKATSLDSALHEFAQVCKDSTSYLQNIGIEIGRLSQFPPPGLK